MFDAKANTNGSGEEERQPVKKDEEMSMEKQDPDLTTCPAVLAGLSREMRTQLNAIVSFSFLMNNESYSQTEKEEFSNQIFESCESMISLFDNFLDSTIIDTGNSNIDPVIANPDQIFRDLFSEFREVLGAERYKDIMLVTECQQVKAGQYLIDVNRLNKVIRNLFRNSLENTKSGYIKVGYNLTADKLTMYFLDSGQGYDKNREFLQTLDPAQALSKYNDPFVAINIFLTRKLIKMLDGSVWIESNGLTGSGIYFSVPVESVARTDYNANRLTDTMITI